MSEKNLFAHFDEILPESWKEKIVQDLKGKDYESTLVWTTPENIKVQPFYTDKSEDSLVSYRETAAWQITAPVHISDIANQQALANLTGGATQIHFIGNGEYFDIDTLTKGIELSYAPVSFQNVQWQDEHIRFWTDYKSTASHLGINPLAELHQGKSQEFALENLVKWIKLKQTLQADWGVLSIDGSIYKNCGGHFIDEIAFIVAALQENLHQLRNAGITSDSIGTIQIRTAIGPNFFFEIAKLKTIRHLAHAVANQYEGADIQILAESADIYHSNLDPQTNILRLTTEGMSAILGGAEAVMLHPYDSGTGNDFSQRISRNIQHLLIEESYFEKQTDPTSGSYYIEQLIQELKRPAWNVFLSIEKYQGYVRSFTGKAIPEFFIFRHKQTLMKDVSKRKVVLLGTNQFPNLTDKINNIPPVSETSLKTTILQSFRLSEPFERLRIRMQQYKDQKGQFPKALLWEHGAVAMRKARSTYAFNFLATTGIPSQEATQPDNWDATVDELKSLQPDIVVLCSDNASWETFIPKALQVIPENTIIILAGKSDEYPVGFSIYEGCDVLTTLQQMLEKLQIA